jgi:hypothetical protein
MFQANRTYLQDIRAAYQESDAKIAAQGKKLESAEERARDFEAKYKDSRQKELEVRSSPLILYGSNV